MIVRRAIAGDVEALCDIVNEIISIGGTTAMETPLSPEDFISHYMTGPMCVSLMVVELDGVLLGYQALKRSDALPDHCGDIATFARATGKVKGVGRALFVQTQKVAREAGFTQINATIRADNVPGLGYYSAMGFQDHSVTAGVRLRDGTPVDRLAKRFQL